MIFDVKQIHESEFQVVDNEGRVYESYTKVSSAIARTVDLKEKYERLMEIL